MLKKLKGAVLHALPRQTGDPGNRRGVIEALISL
jgi:hypothetical protein